MFEYNGPVAAIQAFRTFLMLHGAGLPEGSRDKLMEASTAIGITPFSEGLERMFALAVEVPDVSNREALLQTIGTVAQVAWQDGFGDQTRAGQIRAWAAHELAPAEGAPVPDQPEVKSEYSTLPPPAVEGPVPPAE